MHLVCFSKFKKYENISKNSEKIGHKHTQVTNTRKFSRVFVTCLCLCPIFSKKFEIFSYFLNFEKHTGYICTRVPKRLPAHRFVLLFLVLLIKGMQSRRPHVNLTSAQLKTSVSMSCFAFFPTKRKRTEALHTTN